MLLCATHDLKIILKNFFKKKTLNKSTSGFVEQSLEKNFKVIELPYFITIFFSNILNTFFDGVFINWKFTNLRNDKNLEKKLLKLCKEFKNKKVLIDTRDTSNNYNSEIVYSFDLIVQREKLKKLKNQKIFSSMLPCTLLDSAEYDEPINWNLIGKSEPNDKFKFDIFFSGKKTSQARVDLLKTIETLNLSYAGGLGNKILYSDYLEMIYKSAINLAPEGVGIFTFRHLEIIACCSFLMCPSKINEIELPIPLRDGEDFIGYDDLNDFKEKIDYYLKNPKIRKQIAMNGRKKLEKYYSPLNHGKNIYNKLFKI
tara:strand:- start:738 stop:1676 length:939 start_codon:yes stop_codon:yes gene_type:complete